MTAAPKSPTVTREDREAYIALRGIGEGRLAEEIRSGWYDQENAASYAILARHRLAASTPGVDIAGLLEALRRAAADMQVTPRHNRDGAADLHIEESRERIRTAMLLALPTASPPAAVERGEVARLLEAQMEAQEDLPSSMQRDRGRVWLEGWFDLDAILSALSRDGGKR